jgi:hypothetical protein
MELDERSSVCKAAAEQHVDLHRGKRQAARRLSLKTGNRRAPLSVRGNDLNETPAVAVQALLKAEPLSGTIWEPACGPGAIVKVLRDAGHRVYATDLVDYGCPDSEHGADFLVEPHPPFHVGAILSNPPFKLAGRFVAHAISLGVPKVVMLLRLAFLESDGRSAILECGLLARVYVFRNRLPMMHRVGWDGPRNEKGGMAFAWFVWELGHNGPWTGHRISWESAP